MSENIKTAIMLLGHGSRSPEARQGQDATAAALRDEGEYPIVVSAFLEMTEPKIPTALDQCKREGAQRVVIVPYFLNFGNHVKRDLPAVILEWWAANPDVELIMGKHFGFSPQIVNLVKERVDDALVHQEPPKQIIPPRPKMPEALGDVDLCAKCPFTEQVIAGTLKVPEQVEAY